MRSKEESHDYRYFPDPDLPPLILDQTYVDQIRATMPEMRGDRRRRLERDNIPAANVEIITSSAKSMNYFTDMSENFEDKILASNIMVNEIMPRVFYRNSNPDIERLRPSEANTIINMISSGNISGRQAKEAFEFMWEEGKSAADVVAERGLAQMSDDGAIKALVDQVVAANPDKVAEYRSGKTKLIGFFVGQVMKASQGKANPQAVNALLMARLDA